jgi:multicomponent Na+:H+ antiporter subunit E
MKYIATFLVLFGVYLLLADFAVQELVVGAVMSLMLTVIIAHYVDYTMDYKLPFRLTVFLFVYVPVFVWQLLLANIDVAKRVLNPKLPLNPGFVSIHTNLKGDFARLMLANSITLTPGTLSVDVKGDTIYVHTVNVQGQTREENTKHISALFERILGVMFQ